MKTSIKILISDTSNYVSKLAMDICNKHFDKYLQSHSVFTMSLIFINLFNQIQFLGYSVISQNMVIVFIKVSFNIILTAIFHF